MYINRISQIIYDKILIKLGDNVNGTIMMTGLQLFTQKTLKMILGAKDLLLVTLKLARRAVTLNKLKLLTLIVNLRVKINSS